MAISTIMCLTAVFMLSQAASPNYFRYEDCDSRCTLNNGSCTIQKPTTEFECLCSDSNSTCLAEASPTVVCLRPENPPVGGELIWSQYRNKYHPNLPDLPDHRLMHFALAGFAALLTLAAFLGITVLCMLYDKQRRSYQPFANSSPGSQIDSPYIPTTELIPSV